MMSTTTQIAKHLREVYVGGNWTTSDLRSVLKDITWQQAITPVHSLNTIATLVYHTAYYINALIGVLNGEQLTAKDELSFDHPPIRSQEDWEKLLHTAFTNAELAANLIEQLPDNKLRENFTNEKYGNYYRNLHGIIEHTHYHLGQIVIIKKLLLQSEKM